ncbi:hypothetical protein HanPSC8_Chr15g0692511 [Helianthus annuus]|nr:hypothetical protein HanIR_Chr15g0785791 [Helianthus annuus]KAJ0833620.1 hypothetical protein HanPSC8_Chr15g0692511 [Helianthus annuus]
MTKSTKPLTRSIEVFLVFRDCFWWVKKHNSSGSPNRVSITQYTYFTPAEHRLTSGSCCYQTKLLKVLYLDKVINPDYVSKDGSVARSESRCRRFKSSASRVRLVS